MNSYEALMALIHSPVELSKRWKTIVNSIQDIWTTKAWLHLSLIHYSLLTVLFEDENFAKIWAQCTPVPPPTKSTFPTRRQSVHSCRVIYKVLMQHIQIWYSNKHLWGQRVSQRLINQWFSGISVNVAIKWNCTLPMPPACFDLPPLNLNKDQQPDPDASGVLVDRKYFYIPSVQLYFPLLCFIYIYI